MKFAPSPRNVEIFERAVVDKLTTEALAETYGVSAPRISQIVRRVGETQHGRPMSLHELREFHDKHGMPPLR